MSVGRREFLKTIGVAGAALAGGAALASCAPAKSSSEDTQGQTNNLDAASVAWDSETDVLVVGTGFAGLAAAIEAKKAGSDVVIIDKMTTYGGNSSINGGDMAAVGTPCRKKRRLEDSVDLMMADMLKAGKYYNHLDKVKVLAENSGAAVQWLTDIGVKFTKPQFPWRPLGSRTNTTENATGRTSSGRSRLSGESGS